MSRGEEKPARRRVFFALWPDESVRRQVVCTTRSAVRRSGGRATPPGNLHITLAFLGPLTEADLARAVRVPPVASPAFPIVLDRLGFWEGSRVLWIGPSQIPAVLTRLEAVLWDALTAVGFERERRPYRPHVTLARKAGRVEQAVAPVTWPVAELALVESRPGGRRSVYHALRTWPFAGGS